MVYAEIISKVWNHIFDLQNWKIKIRFYPLFFEYFWLFLSICIDYSSPSLKIPEKLIESYWFSILKIQGFHLYGNEMYKTIEWKLQ